MLKFKAKLLSTENGHFELRPTSPIWGLLSFGTIDFGAEAKLFEIGKEYEVTINERSEHGTDET